MVDGEVVRKREVLAIRLILAAHEGCHVVERGCFHRSEFSRNGLWPLCLPSITELPKMVTPVKLRWSVKPRCR